MADTAAILNEAYGLIEQGDLSGARTLLQPLLESDSQNPDVWWLYTHAAADENEGRRALDRVMALDPQYPGATELRERLGTGPRVLKPLASLQAKPSSTAPTAVSPAPVVPAVVDEPDLDDDDEFAETESTPQRQRLSRILLVAGVIIIIVALLAFLVPSLLNPGGPETLTPVAGLETATFDTALTPVLGFETATIDLLVTPLDGTPTDGGTSLLPSETAFVATLDEFAETATALVVTHVNAQSVTQESVSPTEETAVSTTEATTEASATENALLPSSTDVVEATAESVTTEEPAATLETASITEEPVVTEAVLATAEVVATQEATPEATEVIAVPTEETPAATVEATPTEEIAATIEVTPTEETPVATVEVTPTEESGLILTEAVTAEPTQSPADTLAAKLEVLNVTAENVKTVQTTLGSTLLVEVCAPPVASATTALTVTMNALAETIVDVPDVEAVGVNLACEGDAPRVIAVSSSEAAAYGRGEIDVRTFRQGWTPTDLVEAEGNG